MRFLCITISLWISLAANAAEIQNLEVTKNKGRFKVTADCLVDAPPKGVYEVLTDYTRLHELSSLVTESKFLPEEESGKTLVYTRAHGCMMFFCKTINKTEVMETVMNQKVVTTVIPERSDVDYSQATWTLTPEGDKTRLSYVLETELGFWVPPVIGPIMVRRALAKSSGRGLDRLEKFANQRMAEETL